MTAPAHRYSTYRRLLVGSCVILALAAFMRLAERFAPSAIKQLGPSSSLNFQIRVCDDAWQNDIHHEDDEIDHVPVTLHEGCFSGYVYLPKFWKAWWVQPAGSQTGDWIAYWMPGNNPFGPYLPNQSYQLPGIPLQFRLQGHGRYVIYSNVKLSARADTGGRSIRSPVEHSVRISPMAPTSGQNPHYSLLLQECHREGEQISCSMKATNKTDARTQLWLKDGPSKAIDDEGNQASMDITVSGNDNHLLPNVPLNYGLRIADNHQNAKFLTISLKVQFRNGNDDNDELVYKDVPIQ